ncbi:MFS transporter [Deinococcus marmoris]|uniref:Membrane protein mosC n=1 Tax=Deinococcus marmoris TaxID=249408 RepID=A0A1U7NUA8_9DEIO|nr:MFS transporter [Deinococcus marmoris]OLV16487.1 Membrane protein mosC [Deinococcus marmoris]
MNLPLAAAIRPIWGLFFLNGLLFASWAVQIPAVQERYALNPAQLSGLLFALVVGNVLALPPATALMRRFGVRATALLSLTVMAVGLASLPLAPSLPVAVLAALVYGAGFSGVDLSMNALGTWLEERLERPVMSGFHAAFSIGALLGALVGALLLGRGVTLPVHLIAASALTLVCGAWLTLRLPSYLTRQEPSTARSRPGTLLLLLLAAGFGAALCEGAVGDWAAVYVRGVMDVTPDIASRGFVIFALSMVVGRLAGDRLAARFGRGPLASAAALVGSVGFLIVSLSGSVQSVLPGFLLVGLGLSVLAPLGFSAAWQLGQARGVALMTAVFYGGFLAGPPLVGLGVHLLGLQAAFTLPLILTVLCLILSAGFRVYAERPAGEAA